MRYLLHRVALIPVTMLLVSLVTFMVVHSGSGDLALALATGSEGGIGSHENVEAFRHRYGLDRPLPVQYFDWLGGIARGDLGISPRTGGPVARELRQRLPVTLELACLALVVALLVGLPLGIISAITRNSPIDYLARTLSLLAIATPNFWLATLAILLMFELTGRTPPVIYTRLSDNPIGNLEQMWLPASVLGASMAAFTARFTRSSVLEVMGEDYVRTARAKGLGELRVLWRHVVRTALIPVVTYSGIQFGVLLGGSVVIESIFSVPGIGRYLLEAITKRDFVSVQAIGLVIAGGFALASLVVDVGVLALDPRVRQRL